MIRAKAVWLLLAAYWCLLAPRGAAAWPADARAALDYTKDAGLLKLQQEVMPAKPTTLVGSKLPPNYLTGFLSLGTGQELLDAQAKMLQAWNNSASIARLIANDATQAPVELPPRFKSGPLNALLGELVVLYYAMWQGVEGARRSYYRQVEEDQLGRLAKSGPAAITTSPPFGKQAVPERVRADGFYINNFYTEDNPNVGNGVTAYSGTALDLSAGPLVMSFPAIQDYFLITFYNAYGEVVGTLGTRVGTKTATRVLVVAEADLPKAKGLTFSASDTIVMPGVDGLVLSRILGKQRSREFKVEPALPGQRAVRSSYWWGTDAAVYYLYNDQDPLYFWRVAALVLARNPRLGLTPRQRAVLSELHFGPEGLGVDKLSDDQKAALIAAIPIAAQGMAQSFYVLGPKEAGYWYTTTWNSIPGAYIQLNAAFFKGFWLANIIENAAYLLLFLDSEGRPLNGRYDYNITFKEPPPAQGAFSSLQTMRLDQFAMADAIDTHVTGDIGYLGYVYGASLSNAAKSLTGPKTLKRGPNGWTISMSARAKPAAFDGNFLRLVADVPFYSVLRIYNPTAEVVAGKYAPPAFVRGALRT